LSRSVSAALAVLLLLAGCDKAPDTVAEVRPVKTMTAIQEVLSDLPSQVGDVRPHFESDLGFKLGGKVLWRVTELGGTVRKGDVVARLDEQDQRNQLLAAEADRVAAEANVARTESEERRQARLRQDGWATAPAYESAVQARDTARASLKAVDAKLQLARDQLAYATLRAPQDGVITALGAEAGQVVAAGQMMVRLARTDLTDAVFSIAESALSAVAPGMVVEVQALDAPDVRAEGRVSEISPSADPVTRTYTIKVALSSVPAGMHFGMSVVGRIHTREHSVIAVPVAALFQQDGDPAVWVVDRQAMTVSLVKVPLFRIDPDRVLLAGGLSEGTLVVAAGVQKLRPGQQVRLMGQEEAGVAPPAPGGAR